MIITCTVLIHEQGSKYGKLRLNNYVNGTPAIQDGKIVFGGCDGMYKSC